MKSVVSFLFFFIVKPCFGCGPPTPENHEQELRALDRMMMPAYYIGIMRAIIEIPNEKDQALKRLSRRRGVSRAKLVRDAIDQLLQNSGSQEAPDAFGLWKKNAADGLKYERKLRKEWPE
ncbi:MAG: CopG family transcriptional regulator [Kiritimatiellia bacterium]